MIEQEKELFEQAIEFFNKRDYDNAKLFYERILQINPKAANVYGNLGVIYRIKGDVGTAIKYYIQAINLNPKNPLFYNNLANAFKDIKNYKMAIRV